MEIGHRLANGYPSSPLALDWVIPFLFHCVILALPGWSLQQDSHSSGILPLIWCFSCKLTSQQALLNASAITLKTRGTGTGLDGDSGWGKVWRAAAWAQLGDRDTFYAELKVRTPPPH